MGLKKKNAAKGTVKENCQMTSLLHARGDQMGEEKRRCQEGGFWGYDRFIIIKSTINSEKNI